MVIGCTRLTNGDCGNKCITLKGHIWREFEVFIINNYNNKIMAFCGKCGTQLSEGAKFCPKCGSPVGSKVGLSESTSNLVEKSPISSYSQKEGKSGNKIWKYAALVLCLLVFFYIYGTYDSGNSKSKKANTETTVERPSIQNSTPKQEEKPTMQNDEEFKRQIMDYTSQVQQIMVQMNNVFNSGRSFAGSDLLDLKIKGDKIFDKMISLARQKSYQDAVNMLKEEKQNFDNQWHEMDKIVNRDMYN